MTRIGLITALTVLSATAAYAQGQYFEPAIPRALPEQRVAPAGTLPEEVPPQPALNVRRHEMDADARQCLALPTNLEVHRCAEKYRSRASRTASAAKTAQAAKPRMDAAGAMGAPGPGEAPVSARVAKPAEPGQPAR